MKDIKYKCVKSNCALCIIAFIVSIPLFICAIVFSGYPNLRESNIESYNAKVAHWNTVYNSLGGCQISVSTTAYPLSTIFLTSDSNVINIPDRRFSDNFTDTKSLLWSNNIPITTSYIQNDGTQTTKYIVTLYNNTVNVSFLKSVTTFYSKFGKGEQLAQIGLVVDFANMRLTDNGSLGGYNDISHHINYYTKTSVYNPNVRVPVLVYDINDPAYNIPLIIGYHLGATWGLTASDKLILYSVFWAAFCDAVIIVGVTFVIGLTCFIFD